MIEELEAYLHHITFAQDCFVAYKSILDSLHLYSTQINLSHGFFSITLDSLSKCLCIELAKLYIGSGEERTIRKLIKLIGANCNLFPKSISVSYQWEGEIERPPYVEVSPINIVNDIEEANIALGQLTPIIDQLKIRRNKLLTHNDPQYFDGKFSLSEFPLSFSDVRELIDFAGNFCNKMLSYLNGNVIAYQSSNADDLIKILQKILL